MIVNDLQHPDALGMTLNIPYVSASKHFFYHTRTLLFLQKEETT